MHTHTMRHLAATCLLSLSLTTPALADDWRSQWREALPEVPVPPDAIEGYRSIWTWFVEAWAAEDACYRFSNIVSEHLIMELQARRFDGMDAVAKVSHSTHSFCVSLAAQQKALTATMFAINQAFSRDSALQAALSGQIPMSYFRSRTDHITRISRRKKERNKEIRAINEKMDAQTRSWQTN